MMPQPDADHIDAAPPPAPPAGAVTAIKVPELPPVPAKPPNPVVIGLTVVVLFGLLMLFPALFVLLVIGLGPTLFLASRDRGNDMLRVVAMGTMNLAGVMPIIPKLWRKGDSFGAALGILMSPGSLVMIALSTMGALFLLWICPRIAASTITFANKREAEKLVEKNAALHKDWGEEVDKDAELMKTGKYQDEEKS